MAVWPEQLANTLHGESVSQAPVSNVAESQNAIGEPNTRLLSMSQLVRMPNLVFIMDADQYGIFRTWWSSEIRYGSLKFDMMNPITGVIDTFRVVGAVYGAKPIGRSVWQITMSLEYKQ